MPCCAARGTPPYPRHGLGDSPCHVEIAPQVFQAETFGVWRFCARTMDTNTIWLLALTVLVLALCIKEIWLGDK